MSHAAWSVCWSHWCTVQKRLNRPFWGWPMWAQGTMYQIGSRSLKGRGNFGGCPAHWKALGVCCDVRSKRDHLILNNGMTCDAVFCQSSLTTCVIFSHKIILSPERPFHWHSAIVLILPVTRQQSSAGLPFPSLSVVITLQRLLVESKLVKQEDVITVLARRAMSAARPPTRPAAGSPAGVKTTTDDKRQRAKQYWFETLCRKNLRKSNCSGFYLLIMTTRTHPINIQQQKMLAK